LCSQFARSAHVKDGAVFASSRDVAAFFEKRHDNVLRDIEVLIFNTPDRALNFEETVVERQNPSGGVPIRSRAFDLTRDGFIMLAMGFTGARAEYWKWKFIDAFNAMEAELRSRPRQPDETPEVIMARALKIADATITKMQEQLRSTQEELEDARPIFGSVCVCINVSRGIPYQGSEMRHFLRLNWV
jgi:Rha family phage regulatory protein